MTTDQMSALVQDVLEGHESAIKGFAVLKQLSDHLSKCLDQVKKEAIQEAENYEKTFSLHGFRFEKRSGGRYYDFSNIPAWVEKSKELKDLEEKYKLANSNYEKGVQSVTEDGEVIDLPVVKYRPDVLMVKK